jgi:UDP-N-acetylmuramoyl-L-alanyl-D-glutamate--2,6-diaminopimelate ligase
LGITPVQLERGSRRAWEPGQKGGRLSELGTRRPGGRDVRVTGLAVDSREVRDGYLFAALPGSRTTAASSSSTRLRMGAGAILTDREGARIAAAEIAEAGLPVVVAEDPRQALSYAAALWFGRSPRRWWP